MILLKWILAAIWFVVKLGLYVIVGPVVLMGLCGLVILYDWLLKPSERKDDYGGVISAHIG